MSLFTRPSVRPSVTLRYRGHIRWNSWKIISRLFSVTFFSLQTPKHRGSTPKGNKSGVWKNWLWPYKTGNIYETAEDRWKVTINGLKSSEPNTAHQVLEDTELWYHTVANVVDDGTTP